MPTAHHGRSTTTAWALYCSNSGAGSSSDAPEELPAPFKQIRNGWKRVAATWSRPGA